MFIQYGVYGSGLEIPCRFMSSFVIKWVRPNALIRNGNVHQKGLIK